MAIGYLANGLTKIVSIACTLRTP